MLPKKRIAKKPDRPSLDEIVGSPNELLRKLVAELELLRQPIDFAELESRGAISREGSWYRVNNIWDLPEHVAKKIYKLQHDTKGISAKFNKASKYKELAKHVEEMASERGLL